MFTPQLNLDTTSGSRIRLRFALRSDDFWFIVNIPGRPRSSGFLVDSCLEEGRPFAYELHERALVRIERVSEASIQSIFKASTSCARCRKVKGGGFMPAMIFLWTTTPTVPPEVLVDYSGYLCVHTYFPGRPRCAVVPRSPPNHNLSENPIALVLSAELSLITIRLCII